MNAAERYNWGESSSVQVKHTVLPPGKALGGSEPGKWVILAH